MSEYRIIESGLTRWRVDVSTSSTDLIAIQRGIEAAAQYYRSTPRVLLGPNDGLPSFDSIAMAKGWLAYCKSKGIIHPSRYYKGPLFRYIGADASRCPARPDSLVSKTTVYFPDSSLVNAIYNNDDDDIRCCLQHGAAVTLPALYAITEDIAVDSWQNLFNAAPGHIKEFFVELAVGLLRPDLFQYCLNYNGDYRYLKLSRSGHWVRTYQTDSFKTSLRDAYRRGLIRSEEDEAKRLQATIRYRINEFNDTMMTMGITVDSILSVLENGHVKLVSSDDYRQLQQFGQWDVHPAAVADLALLLKKTSFERPAIQSYIKDIVYRPTTASDNQAIRLTMNETWLNSLTDLISLSQNGKMSEELVDDPSYQYLLKGTIVTITRPINPVILANYWLWLLHNEAWDRYLESDPKDPHLRAIRNNFYTPETSIRKLLPAFKLEALAIVALRTDNPELLDALIEKKIDKLKLAVTYGTYNIISEGFSLNDLVNPNVVAPILEGIGGKPLPRSVYSWIYLQHVPTDALAQMLLKERAMLTPSVVDSVTSELISRVRWYYQPTEKRIHPLGTSLKLWYDLTSDTLTTISKRLNIKFGIPYLDVL